MSRYRTTHNTCCIRCGHEHDKDLLIIEFKAYNKESMPFVCYSCKERNRVRITKKGLIGLYITSNDKLEKDKRRPTIKQHRMNCTYCQHELEMKDAEFLLKHKNISRAVCSKCKNRLMVRRTVKGFYSVYKAEKQNSIIK
jgi:transcription elongation factor Elf1